MNAVSRRSFIAAMLSTGIAPSIIGADARPEKELPWKREELIYQSATTLASLIRSKTISSEELVRAYLARIAEVNPKLNALCQVDEKGALAAARDADAALARGGSAGKLHGVPITIKDSFDTKGIISAAGTQGRRKFIPDKDATVVARLRAAGAIILGKTNTPELTLSYDTDNLVYGRTANPYDLLRTSGGSSGGSAAILAVGGSVLDIGSDTAGSIRIPAHFCGITGLKPTFGRVSRAGHILGPTGTASSRTHVGPMSRFVEDLQFVLSIICGPDTEDPEVLAASLEDANKTDVTKLRVAYFTDTPKTRAHPEMAGAVRAAIKALEAASLKCDQARPPGLETASQLHAALNAQDGGKYYRKLLEQCGTTQLHPQTAELLKELEKKAASSSRPADVVAQMDKLRESALNFMRDFEIIICPPCSNSAPTPQFSGFVDYSYSSFFNLLGWPAAVVRGGRTASALPKGVQIIGRPWKEHEVLAIGKLLEKELGGWKKDFRADNFVKP
jgi:amidase